MMKLCFVLKSVLILTVALAVEHLFAGLKGSGVVLAMALAGYSGNASYDHTNDSVLDLSNMVSATLLNDLFLLGKIAIRGQATNIDHYWLEESLNATYVTLSAAVASGDTTISVVSATGIQIGALLMNETEYGVDEIMQVTAISGTTLTVSRGFGDSAPAAAAHLSGSRLRVIGRPKPEGDENATDESVARSRKHNVCQIFKSEVVLSGTQIGINYAGIPNEFAHQLEMRTLELKRQLGMCVYAGVKKTAGGAGGSDSVYRSFDGIRNFIRNNSSQLDTTSQALSERVVNDLYKKIYDKGGEAKVAVGCAEQLTYFSEMYKDKVRLAASDKQVGVFVTKFLTDLGVELDLVIDRWGLKGDLAIIDPSRISLMPLQNRAWQVTPLAKNGDSMRSMIVGEYTLEFRNAGECAALATGLTQRAG